MVTIEAVIKIRDTYGYINRSEEYLQKILKEILEHEDISLLEIIDFKIIKKDY